MLSRLSAARFRFINEELYTWDGQESPKVFASNPKSFKAYHSGFKQQTKLWPVNPIDLIIKSIKKMPDFEKKVIADFGCGEAKLALELSSNRVYSFDLVAMNDRVTVCDNANTKLYSGSVDLAVHCLSLMSSNISGYIKEANRVLKIGGVLKIAEVESRFEDIDKFAENVSKFNFKLLKKDLTRNLFYFLDFEKVADIGVARKRKLPVLSLQPCLYKKR
uniref:Ribosomal RNA-processing protein 8 n=2 Tax=Lygus hesperus TaxID=30085 RepID=A0A0A9WQG4_LYGHE